MQNRSEKFKIWLTDLTPAKVEALVKLERQARLIGHVKALTGANDEKLIKTLIEISDSLKKEYEVILLAEPV